MPKFSSSKIKSRRNKSKSSATFNSNSKLNKIITVLEVRMAARSRIDEHQRRHILLTTVNNNEVVSLHSSMVGCLYSQASKWTTLNIVGFRTCREEVHQRPSLNSDRMTLEVSSEPTRTKWLIIISNRMKTFIVTKSKMNFVRRSMFQFCYLMVAQ